jgi:hypothetical protein
LNVVEKDHDDNKFIECAVELNAKSIITGDKALQKIKDYMGIKIQSPKQFTDDYSKKTIKSRLSDQDRLPNYLPEFCGDLWFKNL